ncbi:reverse transcriptase [Lithospermum erythrorhizon]|uniref:Reverse transcriptase n=1 Tax=Lithospermum erythrorhizon TaxID=34254 RepID=A0AAV3Q4D1_LITER
MKPFISQLISSSQSAFIPGRNIGDNIHMFQELVQGYHKNDGIPRAIVKIDLQKAYDIIEWDTFWTVMEAMVFPPRFIFLVKQCVEGACFSVNINGTLKEWFKSSRGVRQGDVISSFLFLLVLEVFNDLIQKMCTKQLYRFHHDCVALSIIHLSFVDDMIIFSLADLQSFQAINEKLTSADYDSLIQKICSNILSWQARHLSLGGRAQLIRSSIFGIQNFWCSNVPMPQLLWNIACRKESLWVKWIHSVRLKGAFIWEYKKRATDPWIWKKILQVRPLLHDKVHINIGNGNTTSFLFDPWSSMGILWHSLTDRERSYIQIPKSAKFSEVSLNLPGSRRQTPQIQQLIIEFQGIHLNELEDECKWHEGTGFTQQSVWQSVRFKNNKLPWTKWLWSRWGVPRQAFISWLLFSHKLCTTDRINRWGIQVDPHCVFCNQKESIEHLLFDCSFTAGKSLQKRLIHLYFTGTVYAIWTERNNRCFKSQEMHVDALYHSILVGVVCRGNCWSQLPRTKANWNICVN